MANYAQVPTSETYDTFVTQTGAQLAVVAEGLDTATEVATDAGVAAATATAAANEALGTANSMDGRLAEVERAVLTGVRERPWEVTVRGQTTADMQEAVAEALADRRGTVVEGTLVIPPGQYFWDGPMIDSNPDNHEMLRGVKVLGAGKEKTSVTFAGPDPLIRAYRRLRFFEMSGMTFSPGAGDPPEFAYAFSDASGGFNQRWKFRDLAFGGTWERNFTFAGDEDANLNSENLFEDLDTFTNYRATDAFVEIGGNPGLYSQQVQFLTYEFNRCNFTGFGTFIRVHKGGGVMVRGGSCSAPNATGGAITWFHFPNQNANNSAQNRLLVQGTLFEPKRDGALAGGHLILDSHLAQGSIIFEGVVDGGAIQNDPGMDYRLYKQVGANPWGFGGCMPVVQFIGHRGAGYFQYDGPAVKRGGVSATGSFWYRGPNANLADVIAGTKPVVRYSDGRPRVDFRANENTPNVTEW